MKDGNHPHSHEHDEHEDEIREHARERLHARQEAHEEHRDAVRPHLGRDTTHRSGAKHESAQAHDAAHTTHRATGDATAQTRDGAEKRHDAPQAKKTNPHRAKHATPSRTAVAGKFVRDTAGKLQNAVPLRMPLAPAVRVAIAVALVAAIGIAAFQCSRAGEPPAQEAPSVEEGTHDDSVQTETAEQAEPFEPAAAALEGVPTGKKLQTFSLAENDGDNDNEDAMLISDDQTVAIMSAIDGAEETGDVSMVFYNLETGKGIAYNADAAVYGASSFKAPYALYVCETQVETGLMTLDDEVPGTDAFDPSSYYNNGSYPLSDLIESAIVYSDNNAFGSLRDAFDMQGYDEWARELGLDDALYRADSWYPWYSARTSAKVWTEMYRYLQTQSEAARYLEKLTGETEVSFLRDALEGTGATINDKAGWCADSDPRWNGVCDAGIVKIDGTPYIMSILTGMPDGDESYERYEAVASAVFATREALA